MPLKPVNYSKTIIYKLVCNDLNIKDLYIGSTTDFKRRKQRHKCTCNNSSQKGHNLKIYQVIRENGGWDNWSMIEIEKYPCKDNNEARARERYWYEELKATMNSNRPMTFNREYIEEHKEQIKEYKKQYYIDNKKELTLKKKLYCEVNAEKIQTNALIYRTQHAEEIKVKRIFADAKQGEISKEKRREYGKLYHQKNREKRLEQQKLNYIRNKN